jgi:uncharacterized protein (TIGR02453 family)
MLQASTIHFLENLQKNNNKEWFEKNKKVYELAKQDFINLTASVLNEFAIHDTALAHLEPKKCIFRINRDVRFSKDKSPYKTNFGMSISKAGKSSMAAGYYFHLEPNKCFIGGGLYMAEPENIKKVRQEIDYCWADFNNIITNKKFATTFKDLNKSAEFTLVRPPKGYDETNPAIEYLKLKSFIAGTQLSNEDIANKNVVKTIVETFTTIKPLIDFINNAMEN